MSFRKWWKFAYKNGRIKWCSYLSYKSSEEPMFGIFVHYSTWPIYDVSMNLFCWPPSVNIFNILPGFLWQPLLSNGLSNLFICTTHITKACCLILLLSRLNIICELVPSSTFSWELVQSLTPNLLFVYFLALWTTCFLAADWEQNISFSNSKTLAARFSVLLSWIYFRFYFWHRRWKMISNQKIIWNQRNHSNLGKTWSSGWINTWLNTFLISPV